MAQREPIVYDFKRDQTYEIGAGITVAMCWPLAEDDKLREKQHRNLCCWTLQQLIGDLTGGSRMPWLIKPIHAFGNTVTGPFGGRHLEKRLAAMLGKGNLVMPFLKFHDYGGIELFEGMTRLSETDLMASIADYDGEHDQGTFDRSNYLQRSWRPALPAIHIAAAVRWEMQIYAKAGETANWFRFLTEQRAIEQWVARAQMIEPVALRAFPEIGDRQIRVRLR